jgi:hypothetical protein
MAGDVIAVLPELFFASDGESLRHYWGAGLIRATKIPAGRARSDGLVPAKLISRGAHRIPAPIKGRED